MMTDEEIYNKVTEPEAEPVEEIEDPHNSGMHVNDALNVPNADGKVLINVRHPKSDKVGFHFIFLNFEMFWIVHLIHFFIKKLL